MFCTMYGYMYVTIHGIGNSYVMQIQKSLLKYTTNSLCNNYVICILALATLLKGGIGFFVPMHTPHVQLPSKIK